MKTVNLGAITAAGVLPMQKISKESTRYAVQFIVTGDPTAIVADFEVSLDGTNWGPASTLTFSAGELTALGKFSYVVDVPAPYVRINVHTLTATTAAEVTTLIRWDDI